MAYHRPLAGGADIWSGWANVLPSFKLYAL